MRAPASGAGSAVPHSRAGPGPSRPTSLVYKHVVLMGRDLGCSCFALPQAVSGDDAFPSSAVPAEPPSGPPGCRPLRAG
eukprot:7002523-Prymnesium_polylepis.1